MTSHAPPKRRIGDPPLIVNAVGYGAWQLSNENRPGDQQAAAVLRSAVDGGADLIDTADAYCLSDDDFGHNESLLARLLDRLGLRAEISIATKVGYRRPQGQWVPDGRPEWIRKGCDQSLARLRQDSIALYQLHVVDPDVPIEESAGAAVRLASSRQGRADRPIQCERGGTPPRQHRSGHCKRTKRMQPLGDHRP